MRKLSFVLSLCLSISCTSKPDEQEATPDAAALAEPMPIASASAPPGPPAPPEKALMRAPEAGEAGVRGGAG
jgi:hypothetical protein